MYESWLDWVEEDTKKTEQKEDCAWNDYYSYITFIKLSDRKLIYRILCLIRDLGKINYKKLKKILGWKYNRIMRIMDAYELVINDFGWYGLSYTSFAYSNHLAKATLKIKER